MGASTELVFIDSTKLMIPEVPILAGQVIYSADTNETYYDTGSGIRMQISNSSYLYSEDDRPGLENPKEYYLYIVKSTARLYKYTLGAGWIRLLTIDQMYDIVDTVEELTIGTIWRDGEKIAPRSLATAVFTMDGSTVEDKLKCMSQMGSSIAYVEIMQDDQIEFEIPIPFDNYFELGNFMEVFVGSTLVDERRYHRDGNTLIFNYIDEQIARERDITFKFWYNTSILPVGVTNAIDGRYLIDHSVPAVKLDCTYNNLDIADPTKLATTVATNKLYQMLMEEITMVSGFRVIHAITTGTGARLHIDVSNYVLAEGNTIYLHLHTGVENNATLSVNDSMDIPIYLDGKDPIKSGFTKGDVLSVNYSSIFNKFYVNSSIAYRLQHYTYNYTAIGGESEIVIDMPDYEPGYDTIYIYQNNIRLIENKNFKITDRKCILINYNAKEGDEFVFEIDKVKGNGLPADGNTIMKPIVFTEHVYFKDGIDIEGDLHLNGKFIIEGGVNSDMDISSKHNIIGNQLVSTTETEPPLIIASNIMVENLNADMVDGYHQTDLVSPDHEGELYIDGDYDLVDPDITLIFNGFYNRIGGLRDKVVIKDDENLTDAPKRSFREDVDIDALPTDDPLNNIVIMSTLEDIVWRCDQIRWIKMEKDPCEFDINSLNSMTGEEIPKGFHKVPQPTRYLSSLDGMIAMIDALLYDIETEIITVAPLDYVEPKTQSALIDTMFAININAPTTQNSNTPVIGRKSDKKKSTKAMYLMTDNERFYPITHKSAIIGMPTGVLASSDDLASVEGQTQEFINVTKVEINNYISKTRSDLMNEINALRTELTNIINALGNTVNTNNANLSGRIDTVQSDIDNTERDNQAAHTSIRNSITSLEGRTPNILKSTEEPGNTLSNNAIYLQYS